ncbi:hypothetical protein VDG64_07410 [Xanthomonas campestris pv. raphani]|uniref:hypothetical protein n=1 Tax=Xanthomonas campestris TaxID=339 RepID=UPI002B226489|nr:hypothetical protein [Xanthomonas campestris]MEA9754840.1 hypothetical protein [Xanthomonas campestris pv. raphani]MEA9956631.1 hypothetical protein [Xanthomonas campestris pv. raphani]MEA9960693.1 hypothetical protein [Xanthomonas campestris pv. raphani]
MRSATTGSYLAKPITPSLPATHRMTVTAQGWLFARALPAADSWPTAMPRQTHHAVASSYSPDDGDGAGLAVRARIAGGGFMAYRNALQRTG